MRAGLSFCLRRLDAEIWKVSKVAWIPAEVWEDAFERFGGEKSDFYH